MRKYKKMSKLVNNTGYTPGTPSESNPINYIPSENITMKNTPYPVYGQPLDHNGTAMGNPTYMEPGQEYKFGGASYVAEVPAYKDGGQKSDWISNKIGILMKEGRPQKQAIAIAYSMWEQKHEMGGTQLPMMQNGSFYQNNPAGMQTNFTGAPTQDPNYYQNNPAGMQTNFGGATSQTPQFNFKANPGIPQTLDLKLNGTEPWKNGLGANPNATNALGTVPTDYSSKFPLPAGMKPAIPKDIGYTPPTASEMAKGVQEAKPNDGGATARQNAGGSGITQFVNPYGDIGMDDALGFSGQQFAKGNTGAGVAAAGLALLKGTKTFLGAMGSQKRTNQIMKSEAEDLRKNMTGEDRPVEMVGRDGGYFQNGGEEDMGYESDMIDKYPNSARIESEIASRNPVFGPKEMPKGYVDPKTTVGKSAIDESPLEEASNFDPNSARDTWVQKTGMSWDKAKKLGYTDGSSKGNMKLLSELNDKRFKKENLRKSPISRKAVSEKEDNTIYQGGELENVVVKMKSPRKKEGKKLSPNINAYGIDTNSEYITKWREGVDKASAEADRLKKQQIEDTWGKPTTSPFMSFYQEGGIQSPQEEGQEGAMSNPHEEQGEVPQQAGGDQMQAITQEVAQMLQQGADPQEILQQLVQAGIPQEQAQQIIQMVMQQMQGGQQEATPQLKCGGKMYQKGGDYREAITKAEKDNQDMKDSQYAENLANSGSGNLAAMDQLFKEQQNKKYSSNLANAGS